MIKHLFLLIFILSSSLAFSQTEISGTVTDQETKEPLIGANIVFEDTSTGTATDYDGKYTLTVPEGATKVVISYTGYQDKIITLDNRTNLDIELSSGTDIEEVIVIGYGVVEKRDVTGAVNSIKPVSKDVVQYDDFQGFLQGRATGVYVQSNGNELGAPNTIRIRGTNSLRGDNEPLYVVDGIIVNSATEDAADPLSGGSSFLSAQSGLNGINPQDIESIEVLKDASATAIYGSRGANGVILITTKQGKEGKAKFNYTMTTSVGQVTNLIDVLDGQEFVTYQNEAKALQGFAPSFYTYSDGSIAEFVESPEFMEAKADSLQRVTPVNWYDDIFQNSFNQNHRLTISKGNDKSNLYIAGGYKSARGIIPRSKADQVDFLLNFSQKINDRLTISPRISASINENFASKGTENLGGSNNSIIRQILLNAPLLDYSGDNDTGDDEFGVSDGPRAWVTDYDDVANEVRALASIKIDYKFSDIFTYRILAGGDYRTKERKLWYGTALSRGRIANGEAGLSELDRFRYNIDNTLMFKTQLNKKNKINGTVGFVIDGTEVEQSTFSSSNFTNQDLRANGINNGQVFQPRITEKVEEGLVSFLGRINYGLDNKYLFTLSFRADGTSKFVENNRFSFFPSAAFAWKIIKEDFMVDNNFWSEAKFRLGYGRTGSQAIRSYQTFSRFEETVNFLSTGGDGEALAVVPNNLANRDLIWETTEQINAGLDLGILNDRYTATLDVYYKKTSDLLQSLSIGPSAGFSTFTANQGQLINKGVELGISANILEGPFKWNIGGNISVNRNEIGELGLPPTQYGILNVSAFLGRQISGGTAFKAPANIFIEGQAAGLFYGYQTNGIIMGSGQLNNAPSVLGATPQLGDILYVDQNGDGMITSDDLTIIGDPNPDFTFGISSDFKYKNFSISLFINGVQGNEIANGNLAREDIALANVPANVRQEAYLGAWREGSTNATHPRLFYPLQGDFTDRMVEDGSFVRLTFVTLGYDLPLKGGKGISAVNLFVSGQNLLLFTNYRGFDPEVNSFSFDPGRQGLDWGSFPNQKTFVFGANVSF